MPISAGMLKADKFNVEPQCPPRLQVQKMQSVTWARMPHDCLTPDIAKSKRSKDGWKIIVKERFVKISNLNNI